MKLQRKIQSIICRIALIAAGLCFVFALGITTDVYNLYYISDVGVKGSDLFEKIQPFNSNLVIMAIIMVASSLALFITKTNTRRNYYISNYIATIFVAGIFTAVSVWAITNIIDYRTYFKTQVDFEQYKYWIDLLNAGDAKIAKYTESTFYFDISIATFCLAILMSLLLIGNMIWKILLMKEEKQLLANSFDRRIQNESNIN